MFPGDLYEAALRFAADASSGGDGALPVAWAQAVQMGWPAMLVGEAQGGPGGTLADLGAVIEAAARHGLALPLGRRCALVTSMLAALGDAGVDALGRLAAGELDIDPVDGSRASAQPAGNGVRLDGLLEDLDLSLPSTHKLVVVGEYVLLIPCQLLPAPASRHAGIDSRRRADVRLQGLVLPASVVLARGPVACQAARVSSELAALAVSLEMGATLGALIERVIEYLQQRVQFGSPLASFQVLRHQVVELYVQYECAGALLTRIVGDAISRGRLDGRDASLAKLYVNAVARRAAEASIQLHGGMGMTTELPASLLARRLMVAQFEAGDHQQMLQRLQAVLVAPPTSQQTPVPEAAHAETSPA